MKEKNFRITCTCDNVFTLAEGREESIDEYLKTIDPNPMVNKFGEKYVRDYFEYHTGVSV